MRVRKISEHIRNQNWFAVAVDFIMVVVGVFVALQVNSWNDARIASATADSYSGQLIDDMHAEETARLARLKYVRQAQEHGKAALEAWARPDNQLGAQFLIDAYQTTQMWNYSPQRTTYDELLSGNIATSIPDPVIRSRLANHYLGLELSRITLQERTAFRDELRKYMPHSVQQIVRDKCGDQVVASSNQTIYLALPETCTISIDPETVDQAISVLRTYHDFENDLNRHLGDLDSKLLSLTTYLKTTQDNLEYLEALRQ